MQIAFANNSFNDYMEWLTTKPKTAEKINDFIDSIRYGGPLQGEGTPQKFRNRSTYFRRIDDKNNFVYSVNKDILEIKSCKGHYEE